MQETTRKRQEKIAIFLTCPNVFQTRYNRQGNVKLFRFVFFFLKLKATKNRQKEVMDF